MNQEAWKLVRRHSGHEITRIHRIFYEHRGVVDRSVGPIQISFEQTALVFDAAGDGETLKVVDEPWQDRFPKDGAVLEVSRAFVEQSGKWTSFDMAGVQEYVPLIGARVVDAVPRWARDGRLTGVLLRTSAATVSIMTAWDELQVHVEETRALGALDL